MIERRVIHRAHDGAVIFAAVMGGPAKSCSGYGALGVITHRPKPLRFVWHHILPETCNGPSVAPNLVSLCDNCHYAVHVLLHYMAMHNGDAPKSAGTRKQRMYARTGYLKAVANGTVDKIPNEGNL